VAKDDGLDWQAYFQLRNRLVTALMHSPFRRGGRVIADTLSQDVNHILCLQYGPAALRRLALRDVLEGPAHLLPTLTERAPAARRFLERTGQARKPEGELPAGSRVIETVPPDGAGEVLRRAMAVVTHQMRSPRPADGPLPRLPREAGKWWSLGLLDDVVLDSATGSGGFVLRRSRRRTLALLRDAVTLRARLWWVWPRLARRYRAAAGLASLTSWRGVLSSSSGGLGAAE
jgi:galactofuranosylgalactofuranosylrhamnosyl-N-acetylglucosaminyl-diphospho-decaprenol beta-1,5/1,6-galactofuranosyltransferase